MSTKDKAITLKIANTEVVIGQVYEIAHKFDASAPDGMRQIKATKFPLMGVAEKRGIPFDEGKNIYDTGLYESSFVNSTIPQATKKALVDSYIKLIKKPYEARRNVDVSENNFAFWDNYKYEVRVNKSFDTTDPTDLFDLFHILKQGAACNEGEKTPHLQKAKYTIKNIEQVKSIEDEKLERKLDALGALQTLAKSEQDKLKTVLLYLNVQTAKTADPEVLRKTYARVMDDPNKGHEFVDKFLKVLEKYDSKTGTDEMQYFALTDDLLRAKKITQTKGHLHHRNGEYLGNNLKDIAHKCIIDEAFRKVIDELASEK